MNRPALNNYWLHVCEGVIYISGICFIAYETIMPKIIDALGGAPWTISLAPTLMILGSALPSVLVAGYSDRLPRKKRFVMINCVGQRLPYFLLVPLLLWLDDDHVLVWCVMGAVFVSGVFTGILAPAWFQFVANTVPNRYIPRLFSFRFGLAAVAGIFIGLLVKSILKNYPGNTGFALLFLAAGMLTMSSLFFLSKIREPVKCGKAAQKNEIPPTYREVIGQRDIILFIIVRGFYCGIYIGLAFIPIRVCQVLELDNSWLGIFAMTVVCGSIAGNVFTSFWTHRFSWRSCQLIGLCGYLLTFLLCLFCRHMAVAVMIFFIMGFSRDVWSSVSSALMLSLPGKRLRSKGTALISIAMAPPLILAGLAGAALFSRFNSYNLLFICAALMMLPAIYFSRKLPAK